MMKSADDLKIVENWSKISKNRLEILFSCTYRGKYGHNLIKMDSYIIILITKIQNSNDFINIYKILKLFLRLISLICTGFVHKLALKKLENFDFFKMP